MNPSRIIRAAADLTTIRELWPQLITAPGPRRPRTPRRLTPEQAERAAELWAEERLEVQRGIHGRGASPAPLDLDQLTAALQAEAELGDLADRVASRTQQPAAPLRLLPRGDRTELERPDPRRWTYTRAHGAPWACTWLLGALCDGPLPALLVDDIAATAARVLRAVMRALDGEAEVPAGRCACGTPLGVAPGDHVITCTGCGTTYGRRDWLRLAALDPARTA